MAGHDEMSSPLMVDMDQLNSHKTQPRRRIPRWQSRCPDQTIKLIRRNWISCLLIFVTVLTCFFCAIFIDPSPPPVHVTHIDVSDLKTAVLHGYKCQDATPISVDFTTPKNASAPLSTLVHCRKPSFDWRSFATIGVTVVALICMTKNLPPDLVLLLATVTLLVLGIITPAEAWSGFSNQGVLSVAVLFAVAHGLQQTGVVDKILRGVLGQPKSLFVAQIRLLLPVAAMSAFMNNTPVVAMMIPILETWCKRIQRHKSYFMMPLSFASMVGGMCSLLGTSTNLVIQGLIQKHGGQQFSLFEMAPAGVPAAVLGCLYMAVASKWLLKPKQRTLSKSDAESQSDGHSLDDRRYTISFRVVGESPLTHGTLASSGLLTIDPGCQLDNFWRDGVKMDVETAMDETRLEDGDVLVFEGTSDSIVKLRRQTGLQSVSQQLPLLGHKRRHRRLVEVILSRESACVGHTVSSFAFVEELDAAVVALRTSADTDNDNPDYELSPGDSLLIETYPKFVDRYKHSAQFALVRTVSDSKPPRKGTFMDQFRMVFSLVLLVAMVVLAATETLPLVEAALLALALLIASKCITVDEAFKAVNGRVLLAIVTAFGLGDAMQKTGVAGVVANQIVSVSRSFGSIGLLTAIYLVASVVGCIVSNNATAVLMFPICLQAIETMPSVSFKQIIVVLMLGSSSAFLTPISYQTNLMVLRPGGYDFADFAKFGAGFRGR